MASNQAFQRCAIWLEIGMNQSLHNLRIDQQGQDIAKYAVVLAVILVLVVGTIRLVRQQRQQCNLFRGKLSSVGPTVPAQSRKVCGMDETNRGKYRCAALLIAMFAILLTLLSYAFVQGFHHADPNAHPHAPLHDPR